MSPGLEITLAVLGGGSAFTAISTAAIKIGAWILKRLIREEITPSLSTMTDEIRGMRSSYDLAQLSHEHSTESLHEKLSVLSNEVRAVNERVDFVESTTDAISVRVEMLEAAEGT
ncbi:MAG TPA: hypothetical protein DGD08_01855 [Gemmatimonas aurantiaca]|uniref:Uncharacterized protein n=2 Tax=Gemmatimonas aurantiaca TaxID=173480 RepID=C1AAQ1_GEMAT|nr:hypothetical protein [Gemmatimonas aurantiaca]BAH39307.1 hypothetical protein GAU_2265 [Gemmatimonas aurantiaca T-27]HCT55938.1 hypothetical protein [Gemmatimonas aurantiaca]